MSAVEQPRTWLERASCRGCPTSMFFPEGGKGSPDVKAICGGCPVRNECFEYALSMPAHEDRCGIFAGTTAADRRKYRNMRDRRQEVCLPEYVPPSTRRRGAKRRKSGVPSGGYRWNAEKGKYEAIRKR